MERRSHHCLQLKLCSCGQSFLITEHRSVIATVQLLRQTSGEARVGVTQPHKTVVLYHRAAVSNYRRSTHIVRLPPERVLLDATSPLRY